MEKTMDIMLLSSRCILYKGYFTTGIYFFFLTSKPAGRAGRTGLLVCGGFRMVEW